MVADPRGDDLGERADIIAFGEFLTDFGVNERRSTELEDQIRALIDWC